VRYQKSLELLSGQGSQDGQTLQLFNVTFICESLTVIKYKQHLTMLNNVGLPTFCRISYSQLIKVKMYTKLIIMPMVISN